MCVSEFTGAVNNDDIGISRVDTLSLSLSVLINNKLTSLLNTFSS